jgi:hypothetical protein
VNSKHERGEEISIRNVGRYEKTPVRRPRLKWEDNVKIGLKNGLEWIHLD